MEKIKVQDCLYHGIMETVQTLDEPSYSKSLNDALEKVELILKSGYIYCRKSCTKMMSIDYDSKNITCQPNKYICLAWHPNNFDFSIKFPNKKFAYTGAENWRALGKLSGYSFANSDYRNYTFVIEENIINNYPTKTGVMPHEIWLKGDIPIDKYVKAITCCGGSIPYEFQIYEYFVLYKLKIISMDEYVNILKTFLIDNNDIDWYLGLKKSSINKYYPENVEYLLSKEKNLEIIKRKDDYIKIKELLKTYDYKFPIIDQFTGLEIPSLEYQENKLDTIKNISLVYSSNKK